MNSKNIFQKDVRQAVILAGGLGTRMKPFTEKVPKPMIPVNDKPFMEYLIYMLRDNGIQEVVLLLGYMSEQVVEYFNCNPVPGVSIVYHIGETWWNTGTRVKRAEKLYDETFLLMYCDNYWPLKIKTHVELFQKNDPDILLTVYNNRDGYTRNNISVDESGRVAFYDHERKSPALNGVDMGFFIFRKRVVEGMPEEDFHLTRDFLPGLIEKGRVYAHTTDQVYYSIGSLDRLPATEEYLREQKVVFLDRDGVINKKAPKADYVKKPEEFEFLPGVTEAFRLFHEAGYKVVIITNQAGIARGKMSEEDLSSIHSLMTDEIVKAGGQVEKIYHCPHGWDEGCFCRKPQPGMLFAASKDLKVPLKDSVFIGDDERDKMAGDAAGMETLLVSKEISLLDITKMITRRGMAYAKLFYSVVSGYKNSGKDLYTLSIGGFSRTGKSTLAGLLKEDLTAAGIDLMNLSLDRWIKDVRERKESDSVRERFDYEGISQAFQQLTSGESVTAPLYDSMTRTVSDKKETLPSPGKGILILEGVVALDVPALKETDCKIFTFAEEELRLKRVREFYSEFKKLPAHEIEILIEKREEDEVKLLHDNMYSADLVFSS